MRPARPRWWCRRRSRPRRPAQRGRRRRLRLRGSSGAIVAAGSRWSLQGSWCRSSTSGKVAIGSAGGAAIAPTAIWAVLGPDLGTVRSETHATRSSGIVGGEDQGGADSTPLTGPGKLPGMPAREFYRIGAIDRQRDSSEDRSPDSDHGSLVEDRTSPVSRPCGPPGSTVPTSRRAPAGSPAAPSSRRRRGGSVDRSGPLSVHGFRQRNRLRQRHS